MPLNLVASRFLCASNKSSMLTYACSTHKSMLFQMLMLFSVFPYCLKRSVFVTSIKHFFLHRFGTRFPGPCTLSVSLILCCADVATDRLQSPTRVHIKFIKILLHRMTFFPLPNKRLSRLDPDSPRFWGQSYDLRFTLKKNGVSKGMKWERWWWLDATVLLLAFLLTEKVVGRSCSVVFFSKKNWKLPCRMPHFLRFCAEYFLNTFIIRLLRTCNAYFSAVAVFLRANQFSLFRSETDQLNVKAGML